MVNMGYFDISMPVHCILCVKWTSTLYLGLTIFHGRQLCTDFLKIQIHDDNVMLEIQLKMCC